MLEHILRAAGGSAVLDVWDAFAAGGVWEAAGGGGEEEEEAEGGGGVGECGTWSQARLPCFVLLGHPPLLVRPYSSSIER